MSEEIMSCRASGTQLLEAVEACLDFCATKRDGRRYLMGAFYEVSPTSQGRLTATDGHALISRTIGSQQFRLNDEVRGSVLLSADALKTIKRFIKAHAKTRQHRNAKSFYLSYSDEGGARVSLSGGLNGDAQSQSLEVLKETYPDWRRVVPQGSFEHIGKIYTGTLLVEGRSRSLQSWFGTLHHLYDSFDMKKTPVALRLEKRIEGDTASFFIYEGERQEVQFYDAAFPEGASSDATIGLLPANVARVIKHFPWNSTLGGKIKSLRFATHGKAGDPIRFYSNYNSNDVCVIMPYRLGS